MKLVYSADIFMYFCILLIVISVLSVSCMISVLMGYTISIFNFFFSCSCSPPPLPPPVIPPTHLPILRRWLRPYQAVAPLGNCTPCTPQKPALAATTKFQEKKWPVKYVVFQRFVEIRGFWMLRWNTWFFNASMKYVVFKRFAEIRGSSARPSI